MEQPISKHHRSKKIIMTNEARVLKELRVVAGIGLREAARRWGERLDRLLEIYGVANYKSFYDRVRNYKGARLHPI